MHWFLNLLITGALLKAMLLSPHPALAQQWRPVRGGILFGISGMALVQQQNHEMEFLIVHDNKGKDEGRLAVITIKGEAQPEYVALTWPSNVELPRDLEAIASVPGTLNAFMALSSSGKVYHIRFNNNKTISVLQVFTLPGITPTTNLEGFTLQAIEGNLVAIWAHRGGGEEAATIYWGKFNLNTYQITQTSSANLKVPLPTGSNLRHISDLKVDKAGILFIASASDTGNDGPFESAVYTAGAFAVGGNAIYFRLNPDFVPLYHDNYRKIEAIELVPGAAGGVIFGTDDENLGSSVKFANC
ncbi:hypothetical protein [Microseira wollei]|uniref:Uncharacterized protein n=1 Tax=Microseira wollei NIES-4236 TaxID=2530354 RepID=A0AAV3XAT8_9CYAN|nr:hypothetical protein [Microseira wollei]GET38518.1 hypothetical protein MiSe_32760 [Microseira wollei NIES-4236]